MENLIDYSNYVNAAYGVAAFVMAVFAAIVIYKYFVSKKDVF